MSRPPKVSRCAWNGAWLRLGGSVSKQRHYTSFRLKAGEECAALSPHRFLRVAAGLWPGRSFVGNRTRLKPRALHTMLACTDATWTTHDARLRIHHPVARRSAAR